MNKLKSYAASKRGRDTLLCFGIVIIAYIIVQAAIAGGGISSQIKGLLVPICAYVVMAISLNLTVGILGELSLGHAGFMSVGAFAGIVTTTCLADAIPLAPLRLAVAMVVAGLFAAIAGVIVGVPVLRLKGDYLAIVTLAFGEIIKNLVNVMYLGLDDAGLHFSLVNQNFQLGDGGKMIINGPIGVSGVTKISTFTSGVVLILVTLFFVLNFVNSRTGRAVMAVRDNKIAADSIGISTSHYKLLAFVVSAAFAGMAGTLYAMNFSTVTAAKFDFNTSILVLVFVVLGGLGNIWGSIIAATLLTLLPELLRGLSNYRMLIYAILLIAMMLFNNSSFKVRLLEKRAMRQMEKAEKGIAQLLENVDALIVIPNQNLLASGQKLTMRQSYALADEVLKTDVISIAEIITRHDDINVDFADITTIIKNAGYAHMAIGHAQGKDKVAEVVAQVIKSDLLETAIAGAKRLLVNITMSEDIVVDEIDELTNAITEAVDEDAEIIFGNGYDSEMKDEVYVTVIAADFDGAASKKAAAQNAANAAAPAENAADDKKANAEAMSRAGVKAADNPTYYDDIFNIFKNK